MSYAAKKLLDRYWDRRLPVDPFKLAKAWGARVEALEESAYNNDGLSGLAVIKRVSIGFILILVNILIVNVLLLHTS